MNAFEEYCFGNDYILRFYRVDHGLICTINESMVAELRAVEAKINQQQAEIEELKTKMSLNSYDDAKSVANQLLQADNEPVAWMSTSGNNFISKKAPNYMRIGINDWIPLYTHPAKTLTDEEIGDFTHRMVLCCQVHPSSADINVLGLKFIVEDILRKAQEK